MMHSFEYHVPASVREAVGLLADDAGACPLAGGMSLLSAMKLRLSAPTQLIDLRRIPGLGDIRIENERLKIGAMTRHAEVAANAGLRGKLPALARLAGGIGDRQVRNRGTLGGSIANNDPAACYPAAVLALDATIETDRRRIPAPEFFLDLFETALEPDELVLAVEFRISKRAAYVKIPHPASRFALAGVFVADFGNDCIRVAVTGAGPVVFRARELEDALARSFTPQAAREVALRPDGLNADLAATAQYRAHLVSVAAARAVEAALGQPI